MNEISWPRRYYWSLRREIWEHPSVWIAPVAAAVVAAIGFLVSISHIGGVSASKPGQFLATQPYDFAIGLVMLSAYIAAIFYSLDALYGERRDRSILFWKSLPVSDATTVIAKLSIPVVIIPLITSALTVATLIFMTLLSPTHPPLARTTTLLLYHLVTVHSLWWAPLFGWLFLISAWARRAPFVWATFPLFAIGLLERIAFGTARITGILSTRFTVSPEAIVAHGKLPTDAMTQMTPGPFFSSLGLWAGLAMTAALVALAIRLRHSRGSI